MTKKANKVVLRNVVETMASERGDDVTSTVVSCGNRGLALYIVHEPENHAAHVVQLTKALTGMHRAIELAQRSGVMANWFDSDLNAALAGTELISNLAAEYAMLIPE